MAPFVPLPAKVHSVQLLKRIRIAGVLGVSPYSCRGPPASNISRGGHQLGMSPPDDSFPRPISSVSWLTWQLLVCKVGSVHRGQEERSRRLQTGRCRFDKQGN